MKNFGFVLILNLIIKLLDEILEQLDMQLIV